MTPRFRKLPVDERRTAIAHEHGLSGDEAFGTEDDLIELADVLVESAVGYIAVPVGIVPGLLVDGVTVDVPLATEEPSVVAAASYAGSLIGRSGGFTTSAGRTITTGQVFIDGATDDALDALHAAGDRLAAVAARPLERMSARGGGWRGCSATWLDTSRLVKFEFDVDTRDAMGANVVNTTAEALRDELERVTGGTVLMAILTNDAPHRVTSATFALPADSLARAGRSGREVAQRVVRASQAAFDDPGRAVTHNKGIMNGIAALALATGNDTRALEAAVHRYAAKDGVYRGVSRYAFDGDTLTGRIELPIVLGTVGGAATFHPATRAALRVLGNPDARRLASIAAAVGLAQNFAALFALVSEGIQAGHMGLHANRVAWKAGARGAERPRVVDAMRSSHDYSAAFAARTLELVRAATGRPEVFGDA
ncbi:MAG: hydroxymethylglutaryl-CoA reductase, degradative [Spirochaetaceae bacterium]|nr:MAG: hydroxymethylglutaryl-CoA reductase, degradative [Spirochaetaceae bacterium]